MDSPARTNIPNPISTDAVYHFHRQVERMERDSESEPETPEKHTQSGLLLVTSRKRPDGVDRLYVEYLCDDARLAKLRAQPMIERSEMREHSDEARAALKLGIGADPLLAVRAIVGNTNPATPRDDRPSIPFWSLAYPLMLPRDDTEPPKAGRAWDGNVKLAYGFADFTLEYTATMTAFTIEGPKIAIAVKPTESRVRGKNVLLSMKPVGQWNIDGATLDGLPESSKGSFHLTFDNIRGQRDAPPKTVAIGRCRCAFQYDRVPVSFDEQRLYPAAWEHRIKFPIVVPTKPPQGG